MKKALTNPFLCIQVRSLLIRCFLGPSEEVKRNKTETFSPVLFNPTEMESILKNVQAAMTPTAAKNRRWDRLN